MRIEDEHPDVMQNLEHAVITLYREYPEMTDYMVLRTYEGLLQMYSAEHAGRPVKRPSARGLEVELLDAVQEMCEWRLGRTSLSGAEENKPITNPLDLQTLILCLKRLIKSVKRWTKQGGRQGYLNYIAQFIA